MSNMQNKDLINLIINKLQHDSQAFSNKNLRELAELAGVYCNSCDNRGYLEVTKEDNCQYIESCDTCDHFGIIGDDLDQRAQAVAISDGYKLDNDGKILE